MNFFKYQHVPWHWRLASYYGRIYDDGQAEHVTLDVCRYGRAVLKGGLIALLCTVWLSVVTLGAALPIAWIAACFTVGAYIEPTDLTIMILLVWGTAAALVFTFLIVDYIANPVNDWRKRKQQKASENHQTQRSAKWNNEAFLGTWYKSVKNKFCTDITVQCRTKE